MSIKLIVMDVDGTLTDGKIYMGPDGEVFKAFDARDGYAIHRVLPAHGISAAIITGRQSKIVETRAKELGISHVWQGVRDKAEAIRKMQKEFGVTEEETAFVGDDLMDLAAMKCCGLCACPADADERVKEYCKFVSKKDGGRGAVREFIEWMIERN